MSNNYSENSYNNSWSESFNVVGTVWDARRTHEPCVPTRLAPLLVLCAFF